MPSRYTRDTLLKIALDMVQLPNLDVEDRPNGIIQPHAMCIQWLQDILDFWYHMVPFSSTLVDVGLNCTANQNYVELPGDFIIDMRDGFLVQEIPGDLSSYKRTYRVDAQKYVTSTLLQQRVVEIKYPWYYSIIGKSTTGVQRMRIVPTPTIATQGILWYYALPPKLEAGDKPVFPNDKVMIEYIRIRALEWARLYDPGTSEKFCQSLLSGARAAGLLNQPEQDSVLMDKTQYVTIPSGAYSSAHYSWMGPQ